MTLGGLRFYFLTSSTLFALFFKMKIAKCLVEEDLSDQMGKAIYKLNSITPLGGGIVISRNLFVVDFPQMFSNDRTRLIFQNSC